MPNLDPEEPSVALAVFGQQVQDFLLSDIGDYLLKKVVEEEREGIEALIKSGSEIERGEALAKIWRARSFQNWLGHAIENGLQALALMKEDDHGG